MKRLTTLGLSAAAAIALQTGPVLAQSARALEKANCNASFKGCSGGGNAAPFGAMGSGGVELLLVAGLIALFAWRPLMRRLRQA